MYELTPEERQKIYAEEKARLEAQEQLKAEGARLESQPKPPAGPQKISCSMIWRTAFFVLIGLIALATIVWMISAGRKNSDGLGLPVSRSEKGYVDYTILRSWIPGDIGTGLELLVSPTATRVQVMQLAYHLLERYRPTGTVEIRIFDSKPAWINRDNDDYPRKEYLSHFLVLAMSPPPSNLTEVTWMAIEREQPPPKK
jgi:hypothetical protein